MMTCHVFTHEPGTFHMTSKQVRRPEDIRGLKIRTGNATIAEFVTSLGGSSVQVPIMEAFETLNRGMTEGITIPWGGLVTMNFGKVVKVHTAIPLYVSTFTHNINKNTYNSLSITQKKALDDTCTPEFSAQVYRHWGKEERDYEVKLINEPGAGRTIVKLTPDDVAAWKKSAEPVMASWKAAVTKAGHNADEVYKDFVEEMRKGGALYQ